jgi:hypothetical protein
MKDFKNFFIYLKEKAIKHEFNEKTFETYINRQLMNCDLRNKVIDCNMDIFELDNLIVIF